MKPRIRRERRPYWRERCVPEWTWVCFSGVSRPEAHVAAYGERPLEAYSRWRHKIELIKQSADAAAVAAHAAAMAPSSPHPDHERAMNLQRLIELRAAAGLDPWGMPRR